MRITIDTDTKTIFTPRNTPLGEVIKHLRTIFPNNEWENYSIEPQWDYPQVTWTVDCNGTTTCNYPTFTTSTSTTTAGEPIYVNTPYIYTAP